ncbi:MAG: polyphosphate kinase [Phycisphaerales bacterium]|nr:MAG: polyphosphate kinase [Phycisphaerales bacterium]
MNDRAGTAADSPPAGQALPEVGPQTLFNRDLSWLAFNQRVLELAEDPSTPLLERVKFVSIFANNLDEFFMKRVGLIRRQVDAGIESPSPDGLTPRQQLAAVRQRVLELQQRQADCWERDLRPALEEQGVFIVGYEQLTDQERARLDRWFHDEVFPILTPLAIDPGHRFPFISNLSENLGIMLTGELHRPGSSQGASAIRPAAPHGRFCRLKIPDGIGRLVRCDDPKGMGDSAQALAKAGALRFTPLDQILRANLNSLFPGLTILATNAFRVTRSASVQVEDEAGDLLESVQEELRRRRFARPVRMEIAEQPNPELADFFATSLGLQPEDVYVRQGPLEYGDLMELVGLDLPHLKDKPWKPLTPPRLLGVDVRSPRGDIFAAIREGDIIAHHPYESFDDSVRAFISAASRDPDVLAIKQTIYRTSRDSPFVRSLIRAAEQGKQVACMVELRARFDESRNVAYARRLEHAGVHVAYGIVGLKTHAKCSLVVRRERDGLRAYAHVGTGNYHPHTAQLYTDLSLLTCDPRITGEVAELFNAMTGFSLKGDYEHLLVAPTNMRQRFEELIDNEIHNARAGRPAAIFAKLNSLEDRKITQRLYQASQAGVRIDLCVRGFCCLRPGVPGLSENIRVVSVVGRFLEHSRIYHFADGHSDPHKGRWFIGSADWMYRNLNNRLEAVCPIDDPAARARLVEIMHANLNDQRYAWDLTPDGTYVRRTGGGPGTFATLMRSAQKAHARALAEAGEPGA